VKYFFDTSVLVAAVSVHHMHHAPSQSAYLASSKNNSSCAAHSLAEVYATLTRLPGKQRMSSEQALLVVDDIRQRLTTIALDENEYYSAITDAAAEDILGGAIYDALIAQCALKGNATVIYTWNLAHFRRVGSEVARRAQTP
jgi:predicted nucleic acid-binding protein